MVEFSSVLGAPIQPLSQSGEAPEGLLERPDSDREEEDGRDSTPPPVRLNRAASFVKKSEASFVTSFAKSPLNHKLRRVFDTFDLDQNGQISLEEVSHMIQTLKLKFPEETALKMMRDADTDNNGEVDFEEFTRAMQGSEFAELVTTASFPAEIYKILEEGNLSFLSTFKDFVIEIVEIAKKEVLAANVPLASYGRVHSALIDVTNALTGTAQELLAVEFSQLRTGALESLNAQREAIETRHEAKFKATVDPILANADSRVAAAEKNQAAAEAEAKRLTVSFSEPAAHIAKLEAALAKATERAAKLEVRVKALEEDWGASYPQALAACTVLPPPLPADAPFITRALELRGTTLKLLLQKLDPTASGHVSKVDLRKAMSALGLVSSGSDSKSDPKLSPVAADMHVDALLADLDAKVSGQVFNVTDLSTQMSEWEAPPAPAPPKKSTKGQPKANPKPPVEGSLERALDRAYDDEAHGSRLLYLIELYEKTLKANEKKHASELKLASSKLAADDSSAAAAEAERTEALKAEKEAEHARHLQQVKGLEDALEAEKMERLEEIAKLRGSAEASSAEAVRVVTKEADELKAKLKEVKDKSEKLVKELKSTTDELEATVKDREHKQLEIEQTRQEQEEGNAAYEIKLAQADAALKKAEAAQPKQGGYYFAAAPSRSILAPSSPRHGSPNSSPGSTHTSTHTSPDGLFEKTRVLSEAFDKKERLRIFSMASPPTSPPGAGTPLVGTPPASPGGRRGGKPSSTRGSAKVRRKSSERLAERAGRELRVDV